MIHVIASVFVKAHKMPEVLNIYKGFAPEVNKEKGCREYLPTVDLETDIGTQAMAENVITVVERWESLGAFHAHLNAPHVVAFREAIEGIVEKVSIKVLTNALKGDRQDASKSYVR